MLYLTKTDTDMLGYFIGFEGEYETYINGLCPLYHVSDEEDFFRVLTDTLVHESIHIAIDSLDEDTSVLDEEDVKFLLSFENTNYLCLCKKYFSKILDYELKISQSSNQNRGVRG